MNNTERDKILISMDGKLDDQAKEIKAHTTSLSGIKVDVAVMKTKFDGHEKLHGVVNGQQGRNLDWLGRVLKVVALVLVIFGAAWTAFQVIGG